MRLSPYGLIASGFVVAALVGAGCSSKSSGSAAAKKTPTKTTTGAASAKPTAKPAAKPKAPSTAPPSKPPAAPPKTDPLADSSAFADGNEVGDCTDFGLTDGQGYCLAGSDYVIGCVGTKVKALDCGSYDDANTLTSCLDDTSAGCYALTLSAVDPDITDDTSSGEAVGSCRSPTTQEGRGLCSTDAADVYVCKGGTLFALACESYGAGLKCASSDVGITCQ